MQTINLLGGATLEIDRDSYTVIFPGGRREQYNGAGELIGSDLWYNLIDTVTEGDYIKYIPSKRFIYMSAECTGIRESQYYDPSKVTEWRVFKKSNYGIEIMACNNLPTLTLRGRSGYAASIMALNTLAAAYVNPMYAVSARSIGGSDDSIPKLTEGLSLRVPKTHINVYDDNFFEKDVKQIKEHNLGIKAVRIWLASRMRYGQNGRAFFGVKTLQEYDVANGLNCGTYLYGMATDSHESRLVSGRVCPIVTLKQNLKVIGGDGSKENPYKISK